MDFERRSDGMELGRIRKEPGFFALERLLKRMKDDLFERWANSDDLTKEHCKGALEVLDTLVPTVDQLIESAYEEHRAEREVLAVTRSSGDLAL